MWAIGAGIQPPPPDENAEAVSLIQLIATPERFEGHMVRVIGVAQFGSEESALYLHREDSDLLNVSNAVWLATDKDYRSLKGAFVIVEGRFTAREHGHLGAFPGTIREIRRLQRMRTRADYQRLNSGAHK